MTAREFLKQAYKAQDRISTIKPQIERIESEMVRLGASVTDGSKVKSTPPRDPLGNLLVGKIDKKIELETQLARWENVLHSVISSIEEIDCVTCCKVLRKKYIKGMRLEDIATEMGYSYGYVRSLHAIGLREIRSCVHRISNENMVI